MANNIASCSEIGNHLCAPLYSVESFSEDTSDLGSSTDDPDGKQISASLAGCSGALGRGLSVAGSTARRSKSDDEEEAVRRVLVQQELHTSGVLADEVERLGVNPAWLLEIRAQPQGVYFSEHLTFLPTLFSKLGRFGGPAALQRALTFQRRMRERLERHTGVSAQWGLFTSLDFAVANHGITSGFYTLVGGIGDAGVVRHKFLSCDELKRFSRRGFRDVWLSGRKLQELIETLRKLGAACGPNSGQVGREHLRCEATDELRSAFEKAALSSVGGAARLSDVCVHYASFIAELNRHFVAAMGMGDAFGVVDSTAANLLPTHGVLDWPKFLQAFLRAGVLEADDTLLRYRDGARGFRNLRIAELAGQRVRVIDVSNGETFDLYDLVERSRSSVRDGLPPLILPGAPLRYWATRALGQSLLLDDGMCYAKIDRLSKALHDSEFVLVRRSPVVAPYTRLTQFQPMVPDDPYSGLEAQIDAVRYLEFAKRIARYEPERRAPFAAPEILLRAA